MKTLSRIIIIFAGLIVGPLCHAQQKLASGSLEGIEAEKEFLFEVDYSDAKFGTLTYDELIFEIGEKEWESAQKELLLKFIKSANEGLQWYDLRLAVLSKESHRYKFVLKIDKIDDDGETYGTIDLYDINGGDRLASISYDADGGRWGTRTNLMGDSMENGGKLFGRYLARAIDGMKNPKAAGKTKKK